MQDNKARLRGKSFKTFPKSLWMECSWVFWEEFLVSLLDVSFKWPFTIHLTFWARWHCQFTTATFRTLPELIPSAVGGSVCGPWRDMWWLARTRVGSYWVTWFVGHPQIDLLRYEPFWSTDTHLEGDWDMLSSWVACDHKCMVEIWSSLHLTLIDASDILRFLPNVFLKYCSVVLLCSHSYRQYLYFLSEDPLKFINIYVIILGVIVGQMNQDLPFRS